MVFVVGGVRELWPFLVASVVSLSITATNASRPSGHHQVARQPSFEPQLRGTGEGITSERCQGLGTYSCSTVGTHSAHEAMHDDGDDDDDDDD